MFRRIQIFEAVGNLQENFEHYNDLYCATELNTRNSQLRSNMALFHGEGLLVPRNNAGAEANAHVHWILKYCNLYVDTYHPGNARHNVTSLSSLHIMEVIQHLSSLVYHVDRERWVDPLPGESLESHKVGIRKKDTLHGFFFLPAFGRHGYNENPGAGPPLLLARQGMTRMS